MSSYIGTWPSTPNFRSVNFRSVSNTRITETQSGRKLRSSTAGTRFSATIQYPNMTVADFKNIQNVATQAQGPLNSFDIVLPSISETNSTVTGTTATVDGTFGAGSNSIDIATNKTSSVILKAGDVIRFASHTKVYMVTADVTTDGSGNATVVIAPNLFQGIVDTSSITLTDVPFRMILAGDVQEFKYAVNGFVTYEIDVIEEL